MQKITKVLNMKVAFRFQLTLCTGFKGLEHFWPPDVHNLDIIIEGELIAVCMHF